MIGPPYIPGHWASHIGRRATLATRGSGGKSRRRASLLTLARRSDPLTPGDSTMRIHNLYEDTEGVSHFRDIEVEWEEVRQSNKFSGREVSCSGKPPRITPST